MAPKDFWFRLQRIPAIRTSLFAAGVLLVIGSPAVGLLPGPGGIILFGLGLGLMLKYSEWAKRRYVAFKRRHPNKGRWTDWGLRRHSARRRLELRKRREAAATADD